MSRALAVSVSKVTQQVCVVSLKYEAQIHAGDCSDLKPPKNVFLLVLAMQDVTKSVSTWSQDERLYFSPPHFQKL